MIRYLLDTDITSKANKAKGDQNVQAWLRSIDDDALAISVVTLRERLEGAENAKLKGSPAAADIAADVEDLARDFAGRILPLDEDAARYWARLLVPDKSKADDKAQLAIATARGRPSLPRIGRMSRVAASPSSIRVATRRSSTILECACREGVERLRRLGGRSVNRRPALRLLRFEATSWRDFAIQVIPFPVAEQAAGEANRSGAGRRTTTSLIHRTADERPLWRCADSDPDG